MVCESCKQKTSKMIIYKGGYGCPDCIETPNERNVHLHKRGVNKRMPKMTYADKKHITTRKLRSDGMSAPDSQWR